MKLDFCVSRPNLATCCTLPKNYFLDEVYFLIGGYVNKQNFHIWESKNLNVIIEKPMHPQRLTIWCGFWYGSIIGPLFFENEKGAADTVIGEHYRAMLNEFLFPKNLVLTGWGHNRSFAHCFWKSYSQPKF